MKPCSNWFPFLHIRGRLRWDALDMCPVAYNRLWSGLEQVLRAPNLYDVPDKSVKTIEIKVLKYMSILRGGDGDPKQKSPRVPSDSVTPLHVPFLFWLVVMWLFFLLQNTSLKLVNLQKDCWLFSKKIRTNIKEKKGWTEEVQIQKTLETTVT